MGTVGEAIREAREAAGLTQRELAERIGTQQPAIARLESDGSSPSIRTLRAIAEALGVDLEIGLRS